MWSILYLQAVGMANVAQPEDEISYIESTEEIKCSPLYIQVSNSSSTLCNSTGKLFMQANKAELYDDPFHTVAKTPTD